MQHAGPAIDKYGITVVALGNFHVSIKDEDAQELKKYARDVAMTKMTGTIELRHGRADDARRRRWRRRSGMDMVGMAMAQQMMRNMQGGAPAQPAYAAPAPAPTPADR